MSDKQEGVWPEKDTSKKRALFSEKAFSYFFLCYVGSWLVSQPSHFHINAHPSPLGRDNKK
ncbi:MAG: hypothetical protein D3909_07065 [Candidatus Electrothrix sp. ATG1]|nr:hypothetical protein [Candidatus Electrothrix sp. ATG1]